ncbi:MAG: twin-arginine translocation signal domain-containing protein, partial [Alphaproteobacteria bacterium]
MISKLRTPGLTRRTFLKNTAITAAAAGLPGAALAAGEPIKIGFLAPLTGPVAAWGKPGLDGCQIWAERVNAAGGVMLSDGAHPIEFIGYDNEYDPAKARTGATKLIREDGVSFIMMLGGDTWPGVQPVADR